MKFVNAGSSPLARGTFHWHDCRRRWPRLIPARAGNIRLNVTGLLYRTAHPRSRGEHTKYPNTTAYKRGSSPLARGTWVSDRRGPESARLIPARAGNIRRAP